MAHKHSFGLPLAVLLLAGCAACVNAQTGAQTGTGAVSVTLAASPTELNSTYNPTATITLTATVFSSTGGAVPTGTVAFYDSSTGADLGSTASTLTNGSASLTVEGVFATGGNEIEAIYSGDGTYEPATSTDVNVNMEPSTTSVAVVPSATTVSPGQVITVTATLTVGSPPEGSVAPTGTVTLNLDGLPTTLASLTTVGGVTSATFSLTIPASSTLQSHALQAVYAGNADYAAATSPAVTVMVAKGATVTTVTATPPLLTAGTTETLTATVAPFSSAVTSYSITGTVSFYDNGATLLGTAVVASNTATLAGVPLAANVSHSITAIYSGDTSWLTSTSTALTLIASTLPDTVVLTSNAATGTPGQALVLTVTVTPTAVPALGAEQNPTGNVVFYDGITVIGTAALVAAPLGDSSTATLTTETLPGGQDTVYAFYQGDLYYDAGDSNLLTLDVEDFTIVPAATNPPTNLNIVQGSSGSASFVVTGLGGFNNTIQVVCAVPAQDDMTCTASPQDFTPPATISFVVQTFLPGQQTTPVTLSHRTPPVWPRAAGGAALAMLGIFLLPVGWRARIFAGRSTRQVTILLLLLAGLGGVGIGCSSGVTPVNGTGTPLGVATLKITASANVDNAVVSHSVYLTVNVVPVGSSQ